MAITDRILNGLRSVFGRERDERQAAVSPSSEIQPLATPSSYSSYDGGEYGGLLAVSQNLLARYADYECITGDTQVMTLEGSRSIESLAQACEIDPGYRFPVYTWDHTEKRITVGLGEAARFIKVAEVYLVRLDDGQSFRATGNHQWMLRNGEYVDTTALSPGTSLMPLYLSKCSHKYVQYRENDDYHKGGLTRKDKQRTRPVSRMVAEWKLGCRIAPKTWVTFIDGDRSNCNPDNLEITTDKQPARSKSWEPWVKAIINAKAFIKENNRLDNKNRLNHKVVSVEKVGKEPVFCLEVPGTHNYAVGNETGGVITHNSMDDYPEINCFAEGSLVTIVRDSIMTAVPIENIVSEGMAFTTIGYNRKSQTLVRAQAIDPRLSGRDAEVLALKLSNGRTLRVTPDHKILVYGKGYVEVKDLVKGACLVGMSAGYDPLKTSAFISPNSGKVVLLEDPIPDGKCMVFDVTTNTHNLTVEGVICHNSANHYFASDSTQPNADTGRVVWVESKDEAIKDASDTLLKRRLRLDDEMFSMAYTLVKYGNDFEEVLVTDNGVVGLNYLPPATMRRVELANGSLAGFLQDVTGQFSDDMPTLRQKLAQPQTMPDTTALFEDWQVVHTRLRTRHRRSPYGYGVADGARWIWKRLILLEDAMLMYKLTRAPARFAFYIDVTDIPASRVESFLQRAKRDLKKKKYIDPNTGRLNMRYNPLASDEDFFLPVRDGKELARVDILSGPDYQAIDDVNYFQRKLHGVLKVPKSWLGQEEAIPSRAILSNEDVRSARVTLGIQNVMRHGIERIVRIDMAARGVSNPWQPEFDVVMTMPSGIWSLAHMELKNALADYASRIEPWVSKDFIRKDLLKLSDTQIGVIDKQKEREKEIEMQAQGGGGGGFGADIEIRGNALTEEQVNSLSKPELSKVKGEIKRLEDRLDRRSRGMEDRIMERFDQALQKDPEFAKRHHDRLAFFSLLNNSMKTNGTSPPVSNSIPIKG